MYIDLDQGRVANTAKAMNLAGLDDKNVTGAGFEFLPVDGPETPALPDELDFIVRMAMGPGTTPGECAEEEGRDIDIPVLGSDELVRAALKREVLLTDTIHPAMLLWRWVTASWPANASRSCDSTRLRSAARASALRA